LRLIDSCITQLKAQGPSRTCDESQEEAPAGGVRAAANMAHITQPRPDSGLGFQVKVPKAGIYVTTENIIPNSKWP